jgi:hypothetical protein
LQEFWTINSPLQSTLILLVEHIAVALGAEFKIYLPQLMPQILRVLMHDTSKDRSVTIKVREQKDAMCLHLVLHRGDGYGHFELIFSVLS